MTDNERRYDIDWLRVIAIAFLLIYHIGIIFQPWGFFIGFIQSAETSDAMWYPFAMLNVWRIPLLFFVSGMGLCFAARRRNWKELLKDRAIRILLPLVFGSIFIVPLHVFLFQYYYELDLEFDLSTGHLWFLLNICVYVIQIIGLTFLRKDYNYSFFNFFRKLLKQPYLVYLFMIPFILEAVLMNPDIFTMYVGSGHGFVLGMLAFWCGYIFVAIGDPFWDAVTKMRIPSLIIAVGLYIIRAIYFDLSSPNYLQAIESISWIFAAFGFAYKYMNKPSRYLGYLSRAVYPVYIIHMVFLFFAAAIILPLELSLELSFILIILITFAGCMITYELIIKRVGLLRPLFGLKRKM